MEKTESVIYYFTNAGKAVVKLFKSVIPELKKFDDDIQKIIKDAEKQPEEQVITNETAKPVKQVYKVLS